LRADRVANGETTRSERARLAQRGYGVGGLTALGDRDSQSALGHDRRAVAVLGGVVDVDRQPRQALDQELADQPRMPGSATSQNGDSLERRPRVRELGQVELAFGQMSRHRAPNRRGLLEYLLVHVMLMPVELRR